MPNSRAVRTFLATLALLIGAFNAGAQDASIDIELLTLTADDDRKIAAFVMHPKAGVNPASPGVIFHHGGPGGHGARLIGASRYAAESMAELGYTTITIVSRHSNSYVDEPLENAALDVDAAMNVLLAKGIEDVVLVGNSFGSVRVSMFMRDRPSPHVRAMVHVAPTYDLNKFMKELSDMAPDYAMHLEKLRRAVKDGQGRLPSPDADNPDRLATPPLFQTGFGRPQTAATLLNWWGPDADNHLSDIIAHFEIPQLLLGGTNDRVTQPERLEFIKASARKSPRVDVITYQDGDHYFTGYQEKVASDIAGWLAELGLAPAPFATVRFIDNSQIVEFNGVDFPTRSPGLIYEPQHAGDVHERPAILLLPDWQGYLLSDSMDNMARAIASTGHTVVVPQLQSDGFRGSQNTSFDRTRQDLAAWLDAVKQAGYERVVGVGLGTSGLWLADNDRHAPDSAFTGFVLVNPPISLREDANAGLGRNRLSELVEQANEWIAAGTDRNQVIHAAYQSPYVPGEPGLNRIIQYAPTFLEYYGPDSRMELGRYIDRSSRPILVLAAPNRFYDSDDRLVRALRRAPKAATLVWQAGSTTPNSVANAIGEWLASLAD